LKSEHDYAGGYTSVKDYVRIAKSRLRETFVPLAHPPRHAQIDFGEAIGVIGGIRQMLHVFFMDLPIIFVVACLELDQLDRSLSAFSVAQCGGRTGPCDQDGSQVQKFDAAERVRLFPLHQSSRVRERQLLQWSKVPK
jgi:hypothetical protein